MFLPLTTQEKKVLGFIALLSLLGFSVLAFRHFTAPASPGLPPVSVDSK